MTAHSSPAEPTELQLQSLKIMFEQGVQTLEAGQFDDALLGFEVITQEFPFFAPGHHNLGVCRNALGQTEQALAAFLQALQLAPEHGNSHLNAGKCLLALQQSDEAIAHFEHAESLGADPTAVRFGLGVCYHGQQKYQESRANLEQVAPEHELGTIAQYYIGDGLRLAGHPQKAIPILEAALEQLPDMPELLESLFHAYCLSLRHIPALYLMDRLKTLDPSAPERCKAQVQQIQSAIAIPVANVD